MVPLPPIGKPIVRVPTEIPSLDGQEVVNDFDVSDAESSDGDDGRDNKEDVKTEDVGASSGEYPTGDPSKAPSRKPSKTLQSSAFAAALAADGVSPPQETYKYTGAGSTSTSPPQAGLLGFGGLPHGDDCQVGPSSTSRR
jgi:hypothetical protein